jgi:hypothetical protein
VQIRGYMVSRRPLIWLFISAARGEPNPILQKVVDECGSGTKKRVSAGVEKLEETVTIIVEQVEPGELLYREYERISILFDLI